MPAAYSVELREKAISSYKKGNITQNELSSVFGFHPSTLKRWLSRERSGEGLCPRTVNNGAKPKIDEKGLKIIKQIIGNNPCITLRELSTVYYKNHKVKVGRSVLSRACQRLNMRRKKLSKCASQKDREDVKKKEKNI